MPEQIKPSIEHVWQRQGEALHEAIVLTLRQLNNVLRLDDYHRHGHEADRLGESLGRFGGNQLDLGRLSEVLAGSTKSRAMAAERRTRVEGLRDTLAALEESVREEPKANWATDLTEPTERIRTLADAHLKHFSDIFRTLRIAQLEIRSKYEPAIHDAVFAHFDWRQLSPAELRICPPFVVYADLEESPGATLRTMMELLESRQPLKLVARRARLRQPVPATADLSVSTTMALETLPLALRGVYFLQTSACVPDFEAGLVEALSSPRPSVISILCRAEAESETSFLRRADRAMRARAFPHCLYDPDRARGFVSCFDLSANPDPEELWTRAIVAAVDDDGHPQEITEPFTFAHFACGEIEFDGDFGRLDDDDSGGTPVALSEYLELTPRQRVGKLPVISVPGPDGTVERRTVSTGIVAQTADRLHLWRTLQEVSGVDNPYVHTTRDLLTAEFQTQHDALMKNLHEDMERALASRERTAVAQAVRTLVSHLTGVDPSSIDLSGMLPGGPA